MTWDEFKAKFTVPFFMDLLTQGGALWLLHHFMGKPPAPPPANIDLNDAKQVAHAAVHLIMVGPKRKQGDEAVFSGALNDPRVTPLQRSNVHDLLLFPPMQPHVKEFRFIVALQVEKIGLDAAVQTLQNIGDEPTVQDAFAKVQGEGLLEPEDPNTIAKKIEVKMAKVGHELSVQLAASGLPRESKRLRKWAKNWMMKG
jgi:hypothetical protein